jgi:hypothetical protein
MYQKPFKKKNNFVRSHIYPHIHHDFVGDAISPGLPASKGIGIANLAQTSLG